MLDIRNRVPEPVNIVLRKPNLHACLGTASLFARASGENSDKLGSPLREDGFDRASKSRSVSE